MRHENSEAGTPPLLDNDTALKARTTASESPSCEGCNRPLTGRKTRFCSDRCRMRSRRLEARTRLNDLLTVIEQSVSSLREELEGHRDAPQ